MSFRISRSAQRVIQGTLIALVLFFLIRTVAYNWAEIRNYPWNFEYPLLVSSLGFAIFTFIFLIFLWRLILQRLGSNFSFQKAFKIWFISSLGRYIPGKIWQILGMVYLSQREGIPVEQSTTSAILAQTFSIVPGAILGLVTIIDLTSGPNHWSYLLFPLIAAGVLTVHPLFLERIANFFCRKLRRPSIHIEARFTDGLRFMLFYLLSWLLYGFAFFLFVRSTTGIPWQNFPTFPGIFAGAYLLGLLTVLVPGGLGVREGAMAYLLSFHFSFPVATAVALAARLWLTSAELICVSIAFIIKRQR